MIPSMKKNGLILTGFALSATALLAVTNALTAPKIAEQQELQLRKQLQEILPAERYDNALLSSCRQVSSAEFLGTSEPQRAWLATMDGTPVASLLETQAPDGYNGTIRLLVGIEYDGTLAGVRTLAHQETPGLGDKLELERSDWILSFNGRELTEQNQSSWKVTKDGGEFDSFTGATITPRAVVKAVKNTLLYYQEHKETLLAAGVSSPSNASNPTSGCGELTHAK